MEKKAIPELFLRTLPSSLTSSYSASSKREGIRRDTRALTLRERRSSVVGFPLLGFDDFAAAQAGRANAHTLGGGANSCMHRAQINIPAPLAHVVGMADRIAAHRLLAANFTNLCHRTALQNLQN